MELLHIRVACSEKIYIGENRRLLFTLFVSVHFVQHLPQESENLLEQRAVTILCEALCTHDLCQNIFTEKGPAFSIFLLTKINIASGFSSGCNYVTSLQASQRDLIDLKT